MRKRLEATGRTHLKTGYLQDVRSIGGYVYAKNGRRYALYASVHGERNMAGEYQVPRQGGRVDLPAEVRPCIAGTS